MATWLAETHVPVLAPGATVHFTSATAEVPQSGDEVAMDGQAFDVSLGRIVSVDEEQMILELKSGARFAFRPRREWERPSGISTATGHDWVLLVVSRGTLRENASRTLFAEASRR